MKERKKKILLVADYSNFHATLAKGLRNLGADVTLVSDGGTFMHCERDINLKRPSPGKLGGLWHTADVYFTILRKLKGFDIVSFRDPLFLELKPGKINWLFNRLAAQNPNNFHSYLSTDIPFLDMLEAPDSPLKYSEWFIDGKPNRMRIEESYKWDEWHGQSMRKLHRNFYSKMKGAVTALYEYHKAAEKVYPKDRIAYGGIPVDIESISFSDIDRPKKIRIFLARDYRRKLEKGNDLMEEAARRVVERHPDKAELILLENVPRKQYLEIMQSCHLLLDQMYSYTPATMALEAMASGLTVVSGGEEDYYKFIGETENFPIINSPVHFEGLERSIEHLVLHPSDFAERGRRGRAFVEKHNHMEVVAKRFLDFWTNNL